jgi:hypothetical protein
VPPLPPKPTPPPLVLLWLNPPIERLVNLTGVNDGEFLPEFVSEEVADVGMPKKDVGAADEVLVVLLDVVVVDELTGRNFPLALGK